MNLVCPERVRILSVLTLVDGDGQLLKEMFLRLCSVGRVDHCTDCVQSDVHTFEFIHALS